MGRASARLLLCLAFAVVPAFAATWRYDVRETAPGHLHVDATIPGGRLHIVQGMERFVTDLRDDNGALARTDDNEWICAKVCTIRYDFSLTDAAAAMHDIDFARDMGDALLAPPGSWLLRPYATPDRVRLHVTTSAPRRFVSGMKRIDAENFESNDFPIDVYSGFGNFEITNIDAIEVATIKNGGAIDPKLLRTWVMNAARSVTSYYGRFPVAHVLLIVRLTPSRGGIRGGMAIGGGGASIVIGLGDRTTADDIAVDWQLTHEFVHLTFPSVARVHHWIEEGIATYVEPIARAQAGLVPASRIWNDLTDGLPKGEPQAGDAGLDRTHTWGRTYWGGALFCFAADVEIRRQTKNHFGLQDALRAILAHGGTIDNEWELTRALQVGDAATGTHVLANLYRDMSNAPHPIDLDAMFRNLGVTAGGDAPDAAIRRAIESGRPLQ